MFCFALNIRQRELGEEGHTAGEKEEVGGKKDAEETKNKEWAKTKKKRKEEREKDKSSDIFHYLEVTRKSYSKYHCKKAIKHLGENMKVTLPPYR